MGRLYVGNAFALNMLSLEPGETARMCIRRLAIEEAQEVVDKHQGSIECVIGHPGTALLAQEILGIESYKCQRKAIRLEPGDSLLAITLAFRLPNPSELEYGQLRELALSGGLHLYLVEYC